MKPLDCLFLAGLFVTSGLFSSVHAQGPAKANLAESSAADPFLKNAGESAVAVGGGWSAGNGLMVLEVYSLDKSEAFAVLNAARGNAARYRRVSELAKLGKAHLEILSAQAGRSGQKSTLEAIDEVRYAVGFDAPRAGDPLPFPAAFETRNVGDTTEYEAVISADGRICDLNVVPQRIQLQGFRELYGMAGKNPVLVPTFQIQKLETSLSFPVNEPAYVGSMTPPAQQGQVAARMDSKIWLAFVRMNLISPTAVEIKTITKARDWSVTHLEYSFYSLERSAALQVLASPGPIQGPWERVQALLIEKRARFEHLVSMRGKSGQKSMTQEIEQIQYATAYGAAFEAEGPAKGAGEESKVGNPSSQPPSARKPEPYFAKDFETRNAGITIEVEPVIGPDGVTLDLNHVISSVVYRGDLEMLGLGRHYPGQPVFESRKSTTSQYLLADKQMLVGTFNPPGADGVNGRAETDQVWLLFVRATANER